MDSCANPQICFACTGKHRESRAGSLLELAMNSWTNEEGPLQTAINSAVFPFVALVHAAKVQNPKRPIVHMGGHCQLA